VTLQFEEGQRCVMNRLQNGYKPIVLSPPVAIYTDAAIVQTCPINIPDRILV